MEFSPESGNSCRKLENFAGNWKILVENWIFSEICIFFFARNCWVWPDLAKSHQIQPDLVEISPNLACFCRIWSDFFVAPVGSGCSGFGAANPSLDPPVSVFENGNPPPTDWTFGSGRSRVIVGRFGRVVGLRSGLDSPSTHGCGFKLPSLVKLIFPHSLKFSTASLLQRSLRMSKIPKGLLLTDKTCEFLQS